MKKVLAILLALAMVFCMAACGEKEDPQPQSETYEIAFITDIGQLMDHSFNQGTWEGVENYAKANSKTYKYYQPANGDKATDDDRVAAMQAAVDNGAKIVVCAGFAQEGALKKIAEAHPEVSFVFVDGYSIGLKNVAPIAFQEEQCGYLAGYACVKEGYEKLGFSGGGGGNNPACCRYGYGFVQGANDAAKDLGKNIEMNYTWQYGATFSPSTELYTLMSGWYGNGTQIVFACGGSIAQSVFQAAEEHSAKGVGVDVDQSSDFPGVVITSAMKGLASGTEWALDKFYKGEFASIGDNPTSLGAKDNAVGLPSGNWMLEKFSVDEYNTLFDKIVKGEVAIDASVIEGEAIAAVQFSNTKVNYQ